MRHKSEGHRQEARPLHNEHELAQKLGVPQMNTVKVAKGEASFRERGFAPLLDCKNSSYSSDPILLQIL